MCLPYLFKSMADTEISFTFDKDRGLVETKVPRSSGGTSVTIVGNQSSFFAGGVWTPTFTPDVAAGTATAGASGLWTYQRFGPPGSSAPAVNDFVRIEGVVAFLVTGGNFEFTLSNLPAAAVTAAATNTAIPAICQLGSMPALDAYNVEVVSADVIRFFQNTSVTPPVVARQHIIFTYLTAS